MSTFLDTLKSRLADAQKRHQEISLKLQTVQQEHQAINQELFGWQKSVEAETLREQQAASTSITSTDEASVVVSILSRGGA